MPKSRGRTKKVKSKRRVSRRPQIEWEMVACLQAVAGAEARGDARGALELINEHPDGADGVFFWKLSRIQRLMQLVLLGDLVPRWAVSRWILAQSLTVLDDRLRPGHAEALRAATELRGGPGALPGRDLADGQVKVMDTDWVYRQLSLYEHGGLALFLAHHASADLLAGAERVDEWTDAPMRSLRLVEREPTRLFYEDLASGAVLTVPNSGGSVLTLPGEHVLGRIVPVDAGEMFDGLPLLVGRGVAEECAGAPDAWVDALRRDARRSGGERISFGIAGHNQVLTDVPELVWQLPMLSFAGRVGRSVTPEVVIDAAFEAVRAAMDGSLERRLAADHEGDDVDPWSSLAAALVHPLVLGRAWDELGGCEPEALLALADRLFGPAGDLCRAIAAEDADAA